MGTETGIGVHLECRSFICKYYKLPKTYRHIQVDSLVASGECCTNEGNYPNHWRLDCSTVFALWAKPIATEFQTGQVGTVKGSNWQAVSKARVQRLLGSLHRRMRATV